MSSIKLNAYFADVKLSEETLKESLKNRVSNQPEAPLCGKYVILKQNYLPLAKIYNGKSYTSARFIIVPLNNAEEKIRTVKINDLYATCIASDDPFFTGPDKKYASVETEMRPGNGVSLRRLKRGQLPPLTKALRSGYLPVEVDNENNKLIVTKPFVISIGSNIRGKNVSYVEEQIGVWQVELNRKNQVVYNDVYMMSFEARLAVEEEVNKAIDQLKADTEAYEVWKMVNNELENK